MRIFNTLCAAAIAVGVAGCGQPDAITGDFEDRDIDLYAVSNDWLVYSWSPPNNLSRPLHLVARNLSTGEETELEADWYGRGLDVDGSMLVYARHEKGAGETEIIAYDLASGSQTSVAKGIVSSLLVEGATVAWETRDAVRGDLIALSTTSGGYVNLIEDEGRPERAADSRPRMSGNNLVFLRQDLSTREFTLMHHDVLTGRTETLPVTSPSRMTLDVGEDRVVYWRPNEDAVFAFDLADKTETRLMDTPRFREGPVIYGEQVAWLSTVSREEFDPIGGQPLIDEQDFRSLNVLDMESERVKTPIENRFMLRSVKFDKMGNIYGILPREINPGPEQTSDIIQL